jgi:hypothetical protein
MTAYALLYPGALLTWIPLGLGFFTGRPSRKTAALLAALGWTMYGTASYMIGAWLNVLIAAGLGAGCLWLWWNDGGGDDTKRRLKRWARKFTPVRRTAPQGA